MLRDFCFWSHICFVVSTDLSFITERFSNISSCQVQDHFIHVAFSRLLTWERHHAVCTCTRWDIGEDKQLRIRGFTACSEISPMVKIECPWYWVICLFNCQTHYMLSVLIPRLGRRLGMPNSPLGYLQKITLPVERKQPRSKSNLIWSLLINICLITLIYSKLLHLLTVFSLLAWNIFHF